MRFPYIGVPVQGPPPIHTIVQFRPMVIVRVIGPKAEIDVQARVDTGADDTILANSIPLFVGVTALTSPMLIGGIGAAVTVRFGTVDLEIGEGPTVYRWSANVGFYDQNPSPGPPVLGLNGFLEFFTATFNGKRQHLNLTPNNLAPPPSFPIP